MDQLSRQGLSIKAWISDGPPQQIRLRVGLQDFGLEPAEAISLSRQLAKAVNQLKAAQ